MANPTRPWFAFNARDWLCDEQVMLMSLECQGAYVRLLCLQWENGAIPRNEDAISTMLGFGTKDSRRYFFDRLWPDLKPHFPTQKDHKRRNRRLARLHDAAFANTIIRGKSGKKGGLQTAYNKRLKQQVLQQSSSDGDGERDGDKSKNREEKTLREETPLTPLQGGDKFPAGSQEPGSRATGTNPRAVAAAESQQAAEVEHQRRIELITAIELHAEKKLADGTTIDHGGVYEPGSGMLLWNALKTLRLEQIYQELQS